VYGEKKINVAYWTSWQLRVIEVVYSVEASVFIVKYYLKHAKFQSLARDIDTFLVSISQ
jgi:hypothetical protein